MVESAPEKSPLSVETLVVMATNRGQFIAHDQLEALSYSHRESMFVVIIDGGNNIPQALPGSNYIVIPRTTTPRVNLSGFMCYEGILWALANQVDFKRVFVTDDDTLPIGRGLDTWARTQMENGCLDLLGVTDRVNYQYAWYGYQRLMEEWIGYPVDNPDGKFYPSSETIFFAAHWMSRQLVDRMVELNLLRPHKLERWNLFPDVYISWVCQILGLTSYGAGSMERPQPPLYANHPKNHQRWAPDPRILHPDFKLYHSIRSSTSAEFEIREHYRHERHRDVQ